MMLIQIKLRNSIKKIRYLNPNYTGANSKTEPKIIIRHIIKIINGICKSGELTAILGESGAE